MPSSVPTAMLSNMSSTDVLGGHTSLRLRDLGTTTAGPCTPGLLSQPTRPPASQLLFPLGLRGETSTYISGALADVSHPTSNTCGPGYPCCDFGANPSSPQVPPCARVRPVDLPAQITGITSVTLNPALRFGSKPPEYTVLDVDFAQAAVNVNYHLLAEPATFPGLPSLTVISHRLPWAITAHASGRYLTVADLLDAIRKALWIRVTEEDYAEWLAQHCADQAKPQHCQPGNSSDVLPVKGQKRKRAHQLMRLDLLEGKHRFAGLSEGTMGCDVWMLNIT
ncbi:hypothetical protein DFH07DRAFT_887382 [Mycena maculata]|uniref:DUF6699 domain-containing protein n=1 Tax=Mycena maculata TaxID=230809 RepID=A0AAD7N9Z1_9AGAR|nr:hypothetical protein DFH07DRAFT_887382 [Mycena maculata]